MPHSMTTRRRLLLGTAALAAPWPALSQPLRRPWPRQQPTPALELPGFDGPGWNLSKLRGNLVVLNFWASWCEPCRAELPSLELMAQRHEKDGLIVLAVNYRETDAAIRRFMDVLPTTLPIARDSDGATSHAFGVRVFPTTVIVGRDGRARFSVIGEADWTDHPTRQWIAEAL